MNRLLSLISFIALSHYAISQVSVTRNVGTFTEIDNQKNFDLVLKEGQEEAIVIEEMKNIELDEIITEAKNGKLKFTAKASKYQNSYARIIVTYKRLTCIYNSGSGNILCKDRMTGSNFCLYIKGSGNFASEAPLVFQQIKIDISGAADVKLPSIETTDLQISISGSGNIKIDSGQSNHQTLQINGSGSISLSGVNNEEAEINISGSGSIGLVATKTISVVSSGSGDVSYSGRPQLKSFKNTGSTALRHID
jgi:hypothetical protein